MLAAARRSIARVVFCPLIAAPALSLLAAAPLFPASVAAEEAAAPQTSAASQATEAPPTAQAAGPMEGQAGDPRPLGEDEGELLKARAMWFRDRHAGPDGVIPFRARARALAQLRENLAAGRLESAASVTGDTWISIGPNALMWDDTTFSGRVTAIATHPTQADTLYIGTAQGGVWRTTDGGMSWIPLTDGEASLAIGSLAIDPSNPNRIYAGTGEAFDGCGAYAGSGILKSDDAGAHWTLLGESIFSGTSVSKIVIHPSNPSTLWAASAQGWAGFVCAADPGPLTYGVRKSTDGGATWTLVLGSAQTGVPTYTYDLILHPTNPSILYAAVGGSGVWKTTNGGTSWAKLAGGLPTSDLGRVDLALDRAAPETLYAVYEAAASSSHLGTWKTTNGGSNWTALPRVPVGDVCMTSEFTDICTYTALSYPGFCNYAMYVEVMPGGVLLLGGVGLWRSTNGGSSWINSCSAGMHVDNHAAVADAAGRIWIGCDGGIFRSTDGGASFVNRNAGLTTVQFYPGASLHPTRRNFALAGAQDNGTYRYAGGSGWPNVYTGDGAFTAVDGSNPDMTWYVSIQYLGLFKTTDGGATIQPAYNGLTDAGTLYAAFIAPFAMCPADPSVLIAGSDNVWKTTNGAANWSNNSPDPLVGLLQTIQAMAFAPSDATCRTYFVGMSAGRVFRTMMGGGMAGWTNISSGLPQRGVSDLAVHPTDGNTVYAAVSGFGTPHMYKTTNALAAMPTWTAISAGLPDAPANAILLDPDNPAILYAGTDLGVFRSTNGGASWALFMNGHPNVAVYDLAADSSTGSLVSFTFGRGAWRLENCAVTCGVVGDTLRVARGPSAAELSWQGVSCANLSHYEVYGATRYDAAFPAEWTLLGSPESAAFEDPIGSPWVAYRIRTMDRCGRPSAE